MSETFDLTDPSIYTHWDEVTLRFSDHDGMNHVNNAAYVVYFEVTRVNLIYSVLTGDHIDTVLANLNVNYLKETKYPGTIEVGGRLIGVGNKSFRSAYGIFREGEGLATCESVNVFFDTRSRQATLPTPEIRANLEALLAGPA